MYSSASSLQAHARRLPPLHKKHWRRIMLLPMSHIYNQRQNNNSSPHRRSPVGIAYRDRYADREAAKDDDEAGVEERKGVDGERKTPQTPACRRKVLALDALEQDTADRHHVGRHEGEQGEGDDDVEGEGGAEVDETEDCGTDGGKVHGVEGDFVFEVHLLKGCGDEQCTILAVLQRTTGVDGT